MICEKILGTVDTLDLKGKSWSMWILSGMRLSTRFQEETETGREIGIRMADSVLRKA